MGEGLAEPPSARYGGGGEPPYNFYKNAYLHTIKSNNSD